MATQLQRVDFDRVMFIGLAVILTVLLICFAFRAIPSAARPSVQPPTAPATTSSVRHTP